MNILALDTTTRAGSIAVARDGILRREHSGDPAQTHGQRLPGDIMRTLEDAGIRVDEVDLLAVAAGPGSFTGLRVGVAAVQGLAIARGLKVVPVSTLEALARAADVREKSVLVAAWMDGQRGEVFGALYEALPPYEVLPPHDVLPPEGGSHQAGATEIRPPIAGSPAAVLDAWALPADSPIVFIGEGAVRYRAVLDERFGRHARVLAAPRLAATIARIAFEQPHRAVDPHDIVPVYVRRSDAELARERRQNPGARDSEARGLVDSRAREHGGSGVIERVTSARDLDAVATLEAVCFTNPWTREMLEQEVRQSDVARVYVLRDPDGRIAAFCTCWVILDELHINTIAVDPARRRARLATSLMLQVMDEAARSGATKATLEVRASNEPARRLYATLGFAESGVRPLYYSQPEEDAIILWRDSLA